MSSIYVPSPVEHGSYTLPSDGDPAVAESVNDALRDLGDGVLNANTAAAAAVALANQMVNGVTGGDYAPTADIQISSTNGGGFVVDGVVVFEGGTVTVRTDSTLNVLGPANLSGAVTISGSVTFGDTVQFNAAVTFASSATFTGSLSATGSAITLGNSAADALSIGATTTVSAPITISDTLTVSSIATFNNTVTMNGDVTAGTNSSDIFDIIGRVRIARRLEFQNSGSGIGRVPFRHMTLPDAPATIGIEDGNLFKVPQVSGAWTYNLSDTSAVAGDFMLFYTGGDTTLAHGITFTSSGEAVGMPSGDNTQFNLMVFDGSVWRRCISSVFI